MSINKDIYQQLVAELNGKATLVAVSKTKPIEDIQALYDLGQRDFGENYVQELLEKYAALPKDIRWHFIGHLQSNKVKYIVPFIYLIHGVDSWNLLIEINRQSAKLQRITNVLLQVHISAEESKFGMNEAELKDAFEQLHKSALNNTSIKGLMGMASFSTDEKLLNEEFSALQKTYDIYSSPTNPFSILSMGMSSDYPLALVRGSNMVRIGSLLFGERN